MKVKYARDSFKLDKAKITEDERSLQVPSILSKSGVYDYPDGAAFKSTVELLRATRTARYAKLTIREHPETLVIMSQEQIFGGIVNPYFDRNKIRAILDFDKKFTPEAFLQRVRLAVSGVGKTMENSIGFYYKEDRTPGKAPDVNTGKMRRYDYAMLDIVIDHVAAGAFTGRCTAPNCGLGLDAMMRRIALDPFGKYKNMEECINANKGKKKDPAAFCAWLHKKITGLWPGQNARDVGLFSLIGDIMKLNDETYFLIFGDNDRPPKAWMDNCLGKAKSFATDPGAFCGWLWHHGPEALKKSFGSALRVPTKGEKLKMSENMEKKTPEQLAQEFEDCVKQRMEEMPELTREAAEAICMPATKPKDEATPPGGTLDQEELSPYQACIQEKMKQEGMTLEKAAELCKAEKKPKTDQDAAFENCVARKMEEGMTREDAEKECRKEHPLKPKAEDQEAKTKWQLCIQKWMASGLTKEQARMKCKEEGLTKTTDQEPEPTELEKCIKTQMETKDMTREEAKIWCEAELAGEHEKAQDLIKQNKEAIALKRASEIRKRRERARAR